MFGSRIQSASLAVLLTLTAAPVAALAGAGHTGDNHDHSMMKQMREMHRGHEHAHDFEAMEQMGPEQMQRMMRFMRDIGLALPPMDAGRGRQVFIDKGCVVCHAVNKVGGDIGPSLNAGDMPRPMNAFEFAARMWRGAQAMTAMQQEEFGKVVDLSGQELADLVAFAHDADEQRKLSLTQVPRKYRDKIEQ
ncbi:MAG: c-type cytochrome [Rhizobiales bacterium]|nr:c-type cytochrome [Hyphomicrobiales bacterium]